MANIYYVDGAVGNDSNDGLAEGAGNALATITAGLAKMIASTTPETVYVKASATYTEQVNWAQAGNSQNPKRLIGYSTTPGDNGIVTLDATGQTYGIYGLKNYLGIQNFDISGASSHGINFSSYDYINCSNVHVHDCGGYGFYMDDYCTFIDCTAEDNTNHGFVIGRYGVALNCRAYNNGDYGFAANGDWNGNVLYGCIVTGHAVGEIYPLNCYGLTVINCTIDGQGNASSSHVGIRTTAGGLVIMNTIIYDCYTGIYCGAYLSEQGGGNNCFYSNVADVHATYGWGDSIYNEGDVTSDPLFTDEANLDYSLSASSPCIGAGNSAGGTTDIGAIQTTPSGGGGTSRVVLIG